MIPPPPRSTLFPYTTLFRSANASAEQEIRPLRLSLRPSRRNTLDGVPRSEEHTSELQSLTNLVCRLLLEKKKKKHTPTSSLTRSASLRQATASPAPPSQIRT